jgi:heme/copper-type cytochrome/quinol oxidase subunit 2
MAQKAKAVNAKREAYAKKEEKKGTNIVMWIIGVLIVLGLFYAGWSIYMVS